MKQEFTVGGKIVRLTHEQVLSKLKGVTPGVIKTHGVEVNGLTYPVKEAFACITGLDLLDFNTNQARTILIKLGFKVKRIG